MKANIGLSAALGIKPQRRNVWDESESDNDDGHDIDLPIVAAEEIDNAVKLGPETVASMKRDELMIELAARGMDNKGFLQDQMVALQERMNQEFDEQLTDMRKNHSTSAVGNAQYNIQASHTMLQPGPSCEDEETSSQTAGP
jgi:hypothetical protein